MSVFRVILSIIFPPLAVLNKDSNVTRNTYPTYPTNLTNPTNPTNPSRTRCEY